MDKTLKDIGSAKMKEHENFYVLRASVVSGIVAALLTNSLEVIVLRKQTQAGITIAQIIKAEGTKVLTKGLQAKLMFTTM